MSASQPGELRLIISAHAAIVAPVAVMTGAGVCAFLFSRAHSYDPAELAVTAIILTAVYVNWRLRRRLPETAVVNNREFRPRRYARKCWAWGSGWLFLASVFERSAISVAVFTLILVTGGFLLSIKWFMYGEVDHAGGPRVVSGTVLPPAPEQPAHGAPKPSQGRPATVKGPRVPQYSAPGTTALQPARKPKPRPAADPNKAAINRVLTEFKIDAQVTGCITGPAVLQYQITPGPAVKVSKITDLAANFALVLGVGRNSVRMIAPVPGRSVIGLEIPRPAEDRQVITLRECLESPDMVSDPHPLSVPLGVDNEGNTVILPIHKAPHVLMAGATGAGKSVSLNDLIVSILVRATPEQVRMILIDPKRVELAAYASVPHLLCPIIKNPVEAAQRLGWVCEQMDTRYDDMAAAGVKHIDEYNKLPGTDPWPYWLVIVDELADLMLLSAHKDKDLEIPDVEDCTVRITQLARAAGIHLILATQRPTVDVVTGLIKANVPTRIAFAVASATDSRVILDQVGADRLSGQGDGLYLPMGAKEAIRFQGAFVSDAERDRIVAQVVAQVAAQATPAARRPVLVAVAEPPAPVIDLDLLVQAADLVISTQFGSVSMLQRKLRIGFAVAGDLMDELERRGITGPADGSKARAVLIAEDGKDTALATIKGDS